MENIDVFFEKFEVIEKDGNYIVLKKKDINDKIFLEIKKIKKDSKLYDLLSRLDAFIYYYANSKKSDIDREFEMLEFIINGNYYIINIYKKNKKVFIEKSVRENNKFGRQYYKLNDEIVSEMNSKEKETLKLVIEELIDYETKQGKDRLKFALDNYLYSELYYYLNLIK